MSSESRSRAEQVIAERQREVKHIQAAGGHAEHAAVIVRRAVDQAVAVGYKRVAENLHHTHGQIGGIREHIAHGRRGVEEAMATADRVSDEATPEDNEKVLIAASGQIDKAHQTLLGAHGQIGQLSRAVAETLRGAKPQPTLAALKELEEELTQAGRAGAKAKENCVATSASGSTIGDDSGN